MTDTATTRTTTAVTRTHGRRYHTALTRPKDDDAMEPGSNSWPSGWFTGPVIEPDYRPRLRCPERSG